MNRIRKSEGKYQVLISPRNDIVKVLFERWISNLPSMTIEVFDNIDDAQVEAFSMPDINWAMLIKDHQSELERLKKLVNKSIKTRDIKIELKARLKSPGSLKNKVFNEVLSYRNRLATDIIDDIVGIRIVNPWTKNLVDLAEALEKTPDLKIFEKSMDKKEKILTLHGRTILGTVYEIQLMSPLMEQWYNWKVTVQNHSGLKDAVDQIYQKMVSQQEVIDKQPVMLR